MEEAEISAAFSAGPEVASEISCPKCGAKNAPTAKFCNQCGARLKAAEEDAAPAGSPTSVSTMGMLPPALAI